MPHLALLKVYYTFPHGLLDSSFPLKKLTGRKCFPISAHSRKHQSQLGLPEQKANRAEQHCDSPAQSSRPVIEFSRRSVLAAFFTLSVLKPLPAVGAENGMPPSSGPGRFQMPSAPPDDVLEALDYASELWGRGLDNANSNRIADLKSACKAFDRLVAMEPDRLEWKEARGQVRVDAKRFTQALEDFDLVLKSKPDSWRAHSSRALALEGLADWSEAVDEYSTALRLQKEQTGRLEGYVLNSRGNANASLGRWKDALDDYEQSRKIFQETRQLDGAIYAASNAALVRIQLGQEAEGARALAAVARRAPASLDMRAALAALYWHQGRESEAEAEWKFACDNINSGQYFDSCGQYKDQDWLRRIRRWPPVMADRLDDFFRLRSAKIVTK